MLGSIIGDIVGSRFEVCNHKSKSFDLLTPECHFTDDTVMTLAIAKAFLDCKQNYQILSECAKKNMQEMGRKYPYCNYGSLFLRWLLSENPQPYKSYGNGSAMRVSACAYIARSLNEAKRFSKAVSEITHNHKDAIKGAEAVTVSIYMARTKKSKEEIQKNISKNYYHMDFSLENVKNSPYRFESTCNESVPLAIKAFLDSCDFEDAIRNAVSIGSDSDTIACITGAIAEAYYGIPKELEEKALKYLDGNLRKIFQDFRSLAKI